MTNLQLAQLFRNISAVYQIMNENRFKIIAYERAADNIEQLASEAKEYWEEGKINEIPGIGSTIASHLDELFKTGHAKHFDTTLAKVPQSIFPLLSVPGIGPKRAYKLVHELHLTNEQTVIQELLKNAKAHKIASMEGFGEKSEEEIIKSINTYLKGGIKENRITIREADEIAASIESFLRKNTHVLRVDVLGSLRRRVSTIGDIDIAIVTNNPDEAIAYFCTYKHEKIIEQGPTGASLLLHNGRQIDLRVQEDNSYGAMLQYFTGSKNHNISLRTYALSKGFSLSEYGIKEGKTKTIKKFKNEEAFYHHIGLSWIPPELREDKGEVQAAINDFQKMPGGLPKLIDIGDIRGDVHIHTNFDLEPSHDLGVNNIVAILDKAVKLGYDYIGISDHNPSVGNHSDKQIIDIMKRRKEYYEQQYSSWCKKNKKTVQLYIMLEIDINPKGDLAIPNEAFEYIDAAIISIHSSFQQDKEAMTERLLKAIDTHSKVKIIGHPTGRLLGKREGFEVNWKKIFPVLVSHNIALEINAHPSRLDLPDMLVYDAVKQHVPLIINSDAHEMSSMDNMVYGVSVARRGWATKDDILNTFPYNKLNDWLRQS